MSVTQASQYNLPFKVISVQYNLSPCNTSFGIIQRRMKYWGLSFESVKD